MRALRASFAFALATSLSALATTIPPDLEARADALKRQAPPAVLAWTHDRGVALARAQGPVDSAALERSARAQFGAAHPRGSYPNLGSLSDADIEAICFIVMMEAAKSAQDDLKAIMANVKAINNAKAQQRSNLSAAQKAEASLAAGATPTPTPGPDRVAELVTAARAFATKAHGADFSTFAKR